MGTTVAAVISCALGDVVPQLGRGVYSGATPWRQVSVLVNGKGRSGYEGSGWGPILER
jgi:hypothetical protein